MLILSFVTVRSVAGIIAMLALCAMYLIVGMRKLKQRQRQKDAERMLRLIRKDYSSDVET